MRFIGQGSDDGSYRAKHRARHWDVPDGFTVWEATLLQMPAGNARGVYKDQKMGWSDARGGARRVTQKTKREARQAAARKWLEGRR